MTQLAHDLQPATDVLQNHRGSSRRLERLWLAVTVAAVALVARLYRHASVYELHVDEASYADVSRHLAQGDGLVIYDGPFHLHPPGYFAVLAAVQRLLGDEPDRLLLVQQLRPVGAVLGALTCVVVALLLRRVVGVRLAAVAGLYLALDPFANRFDSRLFLEAPAMLMSVTAISCLSAAGAEAAPRGRLLVGAGLATGAAVLVKEPYAFVSAAPVAVLLLTGWGLRRRDSLTVLGVAVTCYAGYVTGIIATGQWSEWWREKGSGVRRLLGVEQHTGFNAPGSEGVGARLEENLLTFGPTYLAIGVGGLALLWQVSHWRGRFGDPASRRGPVVVLAVWSLVATGYLGYAVAFGTLEEQTFYLLLAPAVTGATLLAATMTSSGRRPVRVVAAMASVSLVLAAGATWTRTHTSSDDGYRQLDAWVLQNLPAGTRVAVTEDTAQFVLRGVDLTTDHTVEDLVRGDVDFVLVSTTLVSRGYGIADRDLLRRLDLSGEVVFSRVGATLGDLRLYDVRALTGGSGAADDLVLPPAPARGADAPAARPLQSAVLAVDADRVPGATPGSEERHD